MLFRSVDPRSKNSFLHFDTGKLYCKTNSLADPTMSPLTRSFFLILYSLTDPFVHPFHCLCFFLENFLWLSLKVWNFLNVLAVSILRANFSSLWETDRSDSCVK